HGQDWATSDPRHPSRRSVDVEATTVDCPISAAPLSRLPTTRFSDSAVCPCVRHARHEGSAPARHPGAAPRTARRLPVEALLAAPLGRPSLAHPVRHVPPAVSLPGRTSTSSPAAAPALRRGPQSRSRSSHRTHAHTRRPERVDCVQARGRPRAVRALHSVNGGFAGVLPGGELYEECCITRIAACRGVACRRRAGRTRTQ
ncbi:hypothetical protein DMC30DRAFT_388225, partial [Rhodotorula diobovata]